MTNDEDDVSILNPAYEPLIVSPTRRTAVNTKAMNLLNKLDLTTDLGDGL